MNARRNIKAYAVRVKEREDRKKKRERVRDITKSSTPYGASKHGTRHGRSRTKHKHSKLIVNAQYMCMCIDTYTYI